jgi:L-aminopeptidase/D-esterase-like protein
MTTQSLWEQLGFAIGHATDLEGATGCTVLRGISGPFRCAAVRIGHATASRELETCAPDHLVDRTDAIVFTGGSAYGLDATAGVMQWMEERQRGFAVGAGVVPIVPAVSLFDLAPLGRFDARPTAHMAYAACDGAVTHHIAEGSVGAGTGAMVGRGGALVHAAPMKGGVGLGDAVSANTPALFSVAIAAVNAFGDVRDAAGAIIAGARGADGQFVDVAHHVAAMTNAEGSDAFGAPPPSMRTNTTLACVAVSVPLNKIELQRLAEQAVHAMRARITPCGTRYDGDVLFAIAPLPDEGADGTPTPAAYHAMLAQLATDALATAIERAVRTA